LRILAEILSTAAGILVFYVCLLPLILIHEFGHFAAGYACGLRLIQFRVGPFELIRPNIFHLDDPLRFRWHWTLRDLGSGHIRMDAERRSLKRTNLRYFIFLLGGPLGNIGGAFLALPIAMQDTMSGGIAKYFVVVSLLLGGGNLIPFSKYGLESDGAQLWALLFHRGKRAFQLCALTFAARIHEIRSLAAEGRIEEARELADSFLNICGEVSIEQLNPAQKPALSAMTDIISRFRSAFVATQGPTQEPQQIS